MPTSIALLELCLLDDLLLQGHHHFPRIRHPIARSSQLSGGGACSRADPDCGIGVDVLLLPSLSLCHADFALTLIEERHVDLYGRADAPRFLSLCRDAGLQLWAMPAAPAVDAQSASELALLNAGMPDPATQRRSNAPVAAAALETIASRLVTIDFS